MFDYIEGGMIKLRKQERIKEGKKEGKKGGEKE